VTVYAIAQLRITELDVRGRLLVADDESRRIDAREPIARWCW